MGIGSLLPLENFVSIKDGKQESVKTTDVWKNTRSSFGKMLRVEEYTNHMAKMMNLSEAKDGRI